MGALVEYGAAERMHLLEPLDDGEEMIAGELARLAGEANRAIGEEDLGLAHAARIEDQLPGGGEARGVLVADAEVEVSKRHPHGGAAPAHVHDLPHERKRAHERRAGLRGGRGLEARDE